MSNSCVKSTCWDTRATDSIIKSEQKDTDASITQLTGTDNYRTSQLAISRSGLCFIIENIQELCNVLIHRHQ